MNKKLLFLDLDGTLLNDEGIITPGNRAALEAALKRGHGVVIATGRPLKSAMDLAQKLALDRPGCYVIAFNGAVLYDFTRAEQIFRCAVPMAAVRRVFDRAEALGLHIQTYTDDVLLAEPWHDPQILRSYCAVMDMPGRIVTDVCAALSREPAKLLAIEERQPEKLAAMEAFLREEMTGELECFYSNPRFLEIVRAGMNKGEAVRRLCGILDIPIRDTVAAGDAANDLSMIRTAGVGVAMANATAQVKAEADYVTENDNNHDGIAEIIGRFLE